jgi:DNA-directed RNA polymerase specialized sigma24 family protein
MEHDEAQLWSLARGGDALAFAAIFDLHRDRVFRQAVRLLDSGPDAEDVSASAFLELFRRRDDVRIVNGSVLPWLLVTTANLARNSTRARRRYRDFLARLPRDGRERPEVDFRGALAPGRARDAAAVRRQPGGDGVTTGGRASASVRRR